jgi:tetratricopeptide (TPR) repeat protein
VRADILLFAGRGADALRSIEQALRLNPRSPVVYLQQLGAAYHQTGQYTEAITTYKQVLVRNPNFMWAYVNLTRAYIPQWAFQLSQDPQTLEQGLVAAQRAVALNGSHAKAHLSLGLVYLYQKHYEQVLTELERAVALDPNEAENNAVLADVLSRVGRPEDALRVVEQALRLQPFVADAHLVGVGNTYLLAGRYQEAIVPLRQFLTRYLDHLGPHLTLAAVYSELGKGAEAQAEAAEVLRLNPQFSLEVHKERAPIKDPATLERHIAALRKAGLK